MNWIQSVLTVVILAGTALSAAAQPPSDSHIQLPWGGGPGTTGEMAKRLNQRLKQHSLPLAGLEPEMARQLLDLAKQHGNNSEKLKEAVEKNKELMQALQNLKLDDPEFQKQLAEMQNRPDPGNFKPPKGLEDLFKNLRPPPGSDGGSASPVRPPDPTIGGTPPRSDPPRNVTNPATAPNAPTGTPPATTPNMPNMPQPSARATGDASSRDFFQRLERGLPDSFRDSPTMNRFLGDIGKTDWSKVTNSRLWKDGQGPNINWSRVGNRLQGSGRFLERNLPSVSGRRLPSAPRINAPSMPRGPNLPNIGGPPAAGITELGGAFTAVVVIGAIALGAFLLWRLLLRPMPLAKLKTSDDGLGPWPVDPSRVKTRAELVQAFDYLALKTCGMPAKVWHHRQVANQLGTDDDQRRRTAASLADAYMRARYTPPGEPFDEPWLQRARHDLCSLAEGTAS